MKTLTKMAATLVMIMTLGGCIVHDGYRGGPGWHHGGGHRGGWHQGHGSGHGPRHR